MSFVAGQGFGINPEIYNNGPGLSNALGGLQTLVANFAVKNRTLISPHVYGPDTTGKQFAQPTAPLHIYDMKVCLAKIHNFGTL